jgi:(p)ppGpp synthase/HD superfamily hydrolase
MIDDEHEADYDGWVEPEDSYCRKCDRKVEMPKKDGPYEYYESENSLHGLFCSECSRQLCDDCGNWQQSIHEFKTLCFDCYNEERCKKFDISIHNAIVFAARKHKDGLRKSTDIPYIAHPMEVMQILIENGCSQEVIIAGILHDTLEDTKTTPEEIQKHFGGHVLAIVQSESEDKNKSWHERKSETVEQLQTASTETLLVCCADKLSNIRSMYADLYEIGDKLWERFNASKNDIQWYYESIVKSLSNISDTDMYCELKEMVKEVFQLDWSKRSFS